MRVNEHRQMSIVPEQNSSGALENLKADPKGAETKKMGLDNKVFEESIRRGEEGAQILDPSSEGNFTATRPQTGTPFAIQLEGLSQTNISPVLPFCQMTAAALTSRQDKIAAALDEGWQLAGFAHPAEMQADDAQERFSVALERNGETHTIDLAIGIDELQNLESPLPSDPRVAAFMEQMQTVLGQGEGLVKQAMLDGYELSGFIYPAERQLDDGNNRFYFNMEKYGETGFASRELEMAVPVAGPAEPAPVNQTPGGAFTQMAQVALTLAEARIAPALDEGWQLAGFAHPAEGQADDGKERFSVALERNGETQTIGLAIQLDDLHNLESPNPQSPQITQFVEQMQDVLARGEDQLQQAQAEGFELSGFIYPSERQADDGNDRFYLNMEKYREGGFSYKELVVAVPVV